MSKGLAVSTDGNRRTEEDRLKTLPTANIRSPTARARRQSRHDRLAELLRSIYIRQDLQCVGWIRTGSPAHTLNQKPDTRRQENPHGATPLLSTTPISRSQFSGASSMGSHRPLGSLSNIRAV